MPEVNLDREIKQESRMVVLEHGAEDRLELLKEIKTELKEIRVELDAMRLKFAKAGGVVLVLMFIATSFGVVIANVKQLLGIVPGQ